MQRIGLAAMTRRLLPWFVVLVASLVAAPAWADPATEGAAKALQKKAIEEDFLNLDYPSAIKKLQSAAAKCDGDKCSAPVKGAVLRDLGAMQVLAGNEGDGRASFGQAIALDGTLELDPSYKNPQLEAVWNDVKKKGGGGGGGGGGGAGPAAGPPPAGDFAHTPATEELVRTPLAIYAEYNGSETLARVIVKYKAAGMTDWKPVELKKTGDAGWGGLVPCKDVAQGNLTYYIQGFNAANDPVATSGSRNKPFTVPVKAQIAGDPPALPGQDPPKQCGELAGAECPPDFPGCSTKKASGEDCDKGDQCKSGSCVAGKCADKKSGGEECSTDDECSSGSCSDSKCTESKKADGEDCDSGDECDSGSCKEGKCSGGGSSKSPRIFIGVAVGLDLYLLPGAQDVCILNGYGHATPQPGDGTGPLTSGNPYSCLTSGGNAFPGSNANDNNNIQKGQSDQVQGGFAHGPLHLMATFDYAATRNILVGARVGYEALTIPSGSAFPPVHLEARFTYLFGRDAVTAKVAPMILAGIGAGEFDAMVPVNVYKKGQPTTPYGVNAWLTAGPVFATAGGGVRLGLSKRLFATGAIKLQGAFGGSDGFLFGVVPELGIQLGF